jgi:hypothetical protein
MGYVKRMIEDVAEDVSILMDKNKMEYAPALLTVLKERKIIQQDSDEDTIKMWDDNIAHLVS